MNSFIIKVLIFGISLIGLCAILDYLVTQGLKDANYRDISKWQEVTSGVIDADLIIVGSSRALVHYDCETISKKTGLSCYNLGLNGSNFLLQKEILELYLRKNKAPSKLIWSIDFNTLGKLNTYFGMEQLVPYMNEPEIRKIISIQDSNPEYFFYFPLIRYKFNSRMIPIGLLSYLDLVKYKRRVINGYRLMDLKWKGGQDLSKKNKPCDQVPIDFLSEFEIQLSELRNSKIEVELVIPPVFRDEIKLARCLDDFENSFLQIAQGSKINLKSYLNSEISLDQIFFYDSFHMNTKGVELWMEEFLQDYQ